MCHLFLWLNGQKRQILFIILCLNEKHVILHPAQNCLPNNVQIECYENNLSVGCNMYYVQRDLQYK